MFSVNDYVVHGTTGVCQITAISKDEYCGNDTEYYVLRPVFNNTMTIKTPLSNTNSMRQVLSKEEVLTLIKSMPDKETLPFNSDKERTAQLKNALKSGNNEERIKIVKTLYFEKEAKSALNKKLNKADDDIMKTAERLINEEFAVALGIAPDEVVKFIIDHIEEYKST